MRTSLLVLLLPLALLIGCPPAASGDDDDSTPTPEANPPRAFAAYSGGSCPTLEDGRISFDSGGLSVSLDLYLPDNTDNAPVLFMWHWLGGSAADIGGAFAADTIAQRKNAIVVAPDSWANPTNEWNFNDFNDSTPELTFFDDMLSCLEEQFDIDERRVYATGMSAGGLWTTKLLFERADSLAAVVIYSGGTSATISYSTPAYPTPALLVWGGAPDVWPSQQQVIIDFNSGMIDLGQRLADDGHITVKCDHGLGHTIPNGGAEWLRSYLFEHSYAEGDSPFAKDDPSGDLPGYCVYSNQ